MSTRKNDVQYRVTFTNGRSQLTFWDDKGAKNAAARAAYFAGVHGTTVDTIEPVTA